MDKLLKQLGNQIQKELIAKLIAASDENDFDKTIFFTEENLSTIFNDTATTIGKTQKQAAKKTRAKRDPNKPSRTNTWMCYCEERRPEIKELNPQATFKDIAQMLSKEWKALDDGEKEKYKDIANDRNTKNGFVKATPKTPKKLKVVRQPKAPKKPKKTTKAPKKPKKTTKAPKKPKKVAVKEEEKEEHIEEDDGIMNELDDLIEEEFGSDSD